MLHAPLWYMYCGKCVRTHTHAHHTIQVGTAAVPSLVDRRLQAATRTVTCGVCQAPVHVYSTANHVTLEELRKVEKQRDMLDVRLDEALLQAVCVCVRVCMTAHARTTLAEDMTSSKRDTLRVCCRASRRCCRCLFCSRSPSNSASNGRS